MSFINTAMLRLNIYIYRIPCLTRWSETKYFIAISRKEIIKFKKYIISFLYFRYLTHQNRYVLVISRLIKIFLHHSKRNIISFSPLSFPPSMLFFLFPFFPLCFSPFLHFHLSFLPMTISLSRYPRFGELRFILEVLRTKGYYVSNYWFHIGKVISFKVWMLYLMESFFTLYNLESK